jgi:hypothetical protein
MPVTEQTTSPDTTTSPTDAPADAGAGVAAVDSGSNTDGGAGDDGQAHEATVLGGEAPHVEADKPADAPAVPEKYEFNAPEGVELDAEVAEAATPILKELGLNNDQANSLLPVAQQLVSKTVENTYRQLTEAVAQQRKDWKDAFTADKEIGGAKADESAHLAAKGLEALGFAKDHPFREALDQTGFGNHPDMIRAFRKIGELVAEDGFVRPDGAAKVEVPVESRWYGSKTGA